jgi:hypothetical protein
MEHILPPLYSASRTWYEGAHHLVQYLIEIQNNWDDIAPRIPFPCCLDKHWQDMQQHQREYARLKAYDDVVKSSMLKMMGWVSNGHTKRLKENVTSCRDAGMSTVTGGFVSLPD